MSTAAAISTDRKARRTALAREDRRLADEAEDLYISLEQIGAPGPGSFIRNEVP